MHSKFKIFIAVFGGATLVACSTTTDVKMQAPISTIDSIYNSKKTTGCISDRLPQIFNSTAYTFSTRMTSNGFAIQWDAGIGNFGKHTQAIIEVNDEKSEKSKVLTYVAWDAGATLIRNLTSAIEICTK